MEATVFGRPADKLSTGRPGGGGCQKCAPHGERVFGATTDAALIYFDPYPGHGLNPGAGKFFTGRQVNQYTIALLQSMMGAGKVCVNPIREGDSWGG